MVSNKTVVFYSVFPPFRGGIAKFSNSLALHLSKIINLIPINFKKQYPNFLFPGKSQFDKSSPYIAMNQFGSTFNPLSYVRLSKEVDRLNPDIFIASYWMTFMAPMLSFVARRRSQECQRILIVHNFIPHEARCFDRFMNKLIIKSFDKFVVLSDKVKNDILKVDKKADIKVIPHPHYNDYKQAIHQENARKQIGVHLKKKTLLFFGLIRNYKGLDILLKAFSELPNDFQLIIAGEVYQNKKQYDALISSSKNKNIYFFDNFIPEDEVHLFFSSTDLCVFPYRSGTQSGVRAIADFYHVPSMLSNSGGIAEGIVHGKNGFLISDLNSHSLSKQIEEVFTSDIIFKVKTELENSKNEGKKDWDEFAKSLINLLP